MLRNSDYRLNIKDLPIGKHSFEYNLGSVFFDKQEFDETVCGDIVSYVEVNKQSSFTQINVMLKGEITVPCDRCLEPMAIEICREISTSLKFDDAGNLLNLADADIYVEAWEIDFETFFYEEIALSIPTRKVHADGLCSPQMLQMLSFDKEEKQESDPRWEALRNFSDNLKKN